MDVFGPETWQSEEQKSAWASRSSCSDSFISKIAARGGPIQKEEVLGDPSSLCQGNVASQETGKTVRQSDGRYTARAAAENDSHGPFWL